MLNKNPGLPGFFLYLLFVYLPNQIAFVNGGS